jgi:hypothetical protein
VPDEGERAQAERVGEGEHVVAQILERVRRRAPASSVPALGDREKPVVS